MNQNLEDFIKKCEKYPPADKKFVNAISDYTHGRLPETYLDLLSLSNGFEGEVANGNYLAFWKSEEVINLNKASESDKSVPGMLLIGGDGGNEAIGIDVRPSSKTLGHYFIVPLIPLGWKDSKYMGPKIEDIKIT